MDSEKKIVLVTGGSGLVGSAIKQLINEEKSNNEEYVFLSSKDADLTYLFFSYYKILTQRRPEPMFDFALRSNRITFVY